MLLAFAGMDLQRLFATLPPQVTPDGDAANDYEIAIATLDNYFITSRIICMKDTN